MDYTEYTAVKNSFSASPNLCDLFKLLSIETWKRIEYAYLKPRVKVFETTVTQNLIFTINAFNDQFNLNIDILEALNEKANGNDFELIIRFLREEVEYYAPIQAKKIYRNGKYTSMDHGDQIESLIDYADKNDARPMFLLYNFLTEPPRIGTSLTSPIGLTGCTLVPAEHLYDNYYNQRRNKYGKLTWVIPRFYDLNPSYAFPWHELVCSNTAVKLYDFLTSKDLAEATNVKSLKEISTLNKDLKQGFYPIDSFGNQQNWVNTKELSVPTEDSQDKYMRIKDEVYELYSKSYNPDDNAGKRKKKERVYPDFAPKSRIVISK